MSDERAVPNQTYLTAVGARDTIEQTATYVNEELYAKGVIDRDQQHEVLWGLRITFLALNTIVANTEVFVGSGRYGTRKPIDW